LCARAGAGRKEKAAGAGSRFEKCQGVGIRGYP
jgi:hypothetical protein